LEWSGAARRGSGAGRVIRCGRRRRYDSGEVSNPMSRDQGATLGRIRAFLASRPETGRGEFTFPMLTAVLRVRRL
jgi:hypothetical protein